MADTQPEPQGEISDEDLKFITDCVSEYLERLGTDKSIPANAFLRIMPNLACRQIFQVLVAVKQRMNELADQGELREGPISEQEMIMIMEGFNRPRGRDN